MLRVSGSKILDDLGREVRVKGPFIWSNKIVYDTYNGAYTQEDYDRIKSWGFDYVYSTIMWAQCQRNKNQPDIIDWPRIEKHQEHIRMAEKAGLNWIWQFRVQVNDMTPLPWASFKDDPSLPTAAWVCTREGLEQYKACIRKVGARLEAGNHPNLIGYNPWMMPFHQSKPTLTERTFFYDNVLSELTALVRSTGKLIFGSAIWHSKDELININPVERDVVYGITFYWYKGMTHGIGPVTEWDYDYVAQREFLQAGIDFKNLHGVPLIVVEFGIRGDTKPQADCIEYKLQLLEENKFSGWQFWSYNNQPEDARSFGILYGDNTPKELILAAYRKYTLTPTPPEDETFFDRMWRAFEEFSAQMGLPIVPKPPSPPPLPLIEA